MVALVKFKSWHYPHYSIINSINHVAFCIHIRYHNLCSTLSRTMLFQGMVWLQGFVFVLGMLLSIKQIDIHILMITMLWSALKILSGRTKCMTGIKLDSYLLPLAVYILSLLHVFVFVFKAMRAIRLIDNKTLPQEWHCSMSWKISISRSTLMTQNSMVICKCSAWTVVAHLMLTVQRSVL